MKKIIFFLLAKLSINYLCILMGGIDELTREIERETEAGGKIDRKRNIFQ